MIARRRTWAAALMALALTGGSAGCPRHLPIARPYPPPTAAELGDALTARQRAVTSMNARVRATSWMGGDRIRATVLMLVDRPGRLRLEAEVSLQGTVAILATDGQQFAFLDTTKNELRRGPACPANVASLIRIPLGPADVAAIMLGDARAPADTNLAEATVDWDANRGADVLVVKQGEGWLRFLFQRAGGGNRRDRLVGALATGPDGRTRWRVAFEDFAEVTTMAATSAAPAPGAPAAASAPVAPAAASGTPASSAPARVPLPQIIRFAEGDASFDDGVEIKFKERTVNEALVDGAFALPSPPGAATIEVGCPPGGASRG